MTKEVFIYFLPISLTVVQEKQSGSFHNYQLTLSEQLRHLFKQRRDSFLNLLFLQSSIIYTVMLCPKPLTQSLHSECHMWLNSLIYKACSSTIVHSI